MSQLTRRALLRSTAAASGTAVVGSIAGCMDSVPFVGGGGNAPAPGSTVPDDAEGLVSMDFAAMLEDDDVKEIGNTFLGGLSEMDEYTGPEDVDGALDRMEDSANLDPRGLTGATVFFELGGGQGYGGVVFNTEWTTDDLVDALEDGGARLDENTYAGKTIYEAESGMGSALGVLSDGQFVLGSLEAVEDTLDVSAGNDDPLSGDLLDRFNGATSGYMNFASEVPGMLLPTTTGGGTDVEGLDELEVVSGGFYKNGGNFGVEVNMHTDDSSSASDLSESLSDLRDDQSSAVENPDVEDLIEKIQFSASGSTATVSLEESVSTVNDYVEEYAAAIASTAFGSLFGLGLVLGGAGSGQQTQPVPQVAFGFDYDQGESYGGSGPNTFQGSDGVITITHQSGDTVRASELRIRGDGVATGVWRDTSAPRNLGGDASGDIGSDPAVVAGDGVTVEARSDYTVRVVYVPEDGGESAVLATDSGPDA